MIENALILHQGVNDFANPASEDIVECLQKIAFIGAPIEYENHTHYRPGDEFLYLLAFLGCSPVVALGEPGATGESFCHIATSPATASPTLLFGENVKTPRCRGCGHRFEKWRVLLNLNESGVPGVEQLTCPACGKSSALERLNWRQSAGLSRRFIAIYGIFEGEAVPGESLMGALEALTGTPWRYFYYRGALLGSEA